jgi:hypothetical protein
VLDERDTPEFWHISVELLDGTSNSVVYEVVEGGWLSQQLPHSPLMQSGFYSSIKEYLVAGDADLVSVLSEDEPKILRISESAWPNISFKADCFAPLNSIVSNLAV